VLERLVALDELHEEGHRLLLEAYAATGARARAIQHYRNLAAWLKRELDTQPEPRTTSLYQRILESDAG
jgi:DNA-binding SARP family transcriptional activator